MEMIFRGKHVALEDGFREYAGGKLSRLARYLPAAAHAIVDVRQESKGAGRFVVQVTLDVNGTYLRAEEHATALETAVDAASDALYRQAVRFKEKKLYRSERRVDKEALAGAEGEEEPGAPPGAEIISGHVVKRKSFNVKPMTEAEAIDQMELLGHNFFLFRDDDRQALALLYRRRDGDYGLILPESP